MMNTRSKTRGAAEGRGSSSQQAAGGSKQSSGSQHKPPEPSRHSKRVAKLRDQDLEPFMKEFQTFKKRKALRETKTLKKLKVKQQARVEQGYISVEEEKDDEDESIDEDKHEYDTDEFISSAEESSDSWDLQDSDDESQEVLLEDSVQEAAPVMWLNDDCLLHVFSFLNGKQRLCAQQVCRNWKRVGEQFDVLNSHDFCVVVSVVPYMHEYCWKKINWDAFLRALTRAGNSVRDLDLSGVVSRSHHFQQLQTVIEEGGCSGVKRLVVRSKHSFWSNGVESLAEMCTGLPRLRCLVIRMCLEMSPATLDRLGEQVLPRIQELELTWRMGGDCSQMAAEAWARFFERIPSGLRRLSMGGAAESCCFLRLLVARLERGGGLGELRALHLNMETTYGLPDKTEAELGASLLQRLLELLGKQLTEFSLFWEWESMPGAMSHCTKMTALRKLRLHVDEIKGRVLSSLDRMCNLRELRIECRRVCLEGMFPYARLSPHPGLEVLVLPVDPEERLEILLDQISMPNLRTLCLCHKTSTDNFPQIYFGRGVCIPRIHLITRLAGLVGRCPRLEVLSLVETWKITKRRSDWWLTVMLLCQLEIALLHSRCAAPNSDSQPGGSGGQGSSSSVLLQSHAPYSHLARSDSMGIPHQRNEFGTTYYLLQQILGRSLTRYYTYPKNWSMEAMEVAVLEMLREREKYAGGGDEMVRPLHVKLSRMKMLNKRSADQELKAKCILEEKFIHSLFTQKSRVLRVSIEKFSNM